MKKHRANLSHDYFTNRQDRYIIFERNKALASYYHELLCAVQSFSYRLKTSSSSRWPYDLVMAEGTPDPVQHSKQFKAHVHDRLVRFIQRSMQREETLEIEGGDTALLPVIQMGPFKIRQDEETTLELLRIAHQHTMENKWTIHLTSGYFNFTDQYKSFILKTDARFKFLTASPEVTRERHKSLISHYPLIPVTG